MRVPDIFPREHLVGERLQAAIAQSRQGLVHHAVPQSALIGQVARAQAAAAELDALADEGRERDAGGQGGAAEVAEVDDAAVGSDGLQVGREVGLTDEVDDDVNPFPARGGEDLPGPRFVRVAVVEAFGGAEGAGAEGDFLVAAGRDVDRGRARQQRELDPGDGHPGRARVPENGVSALEAADEMEGLVRGYPDLFGNENQRGGGQGLAGRSESR